MTARDNLIRALADFVIGEVQGTDRGHQAMTEATAYVDAIAEHCGLVHAFLDEAQTAAVIALDIAHAANEPKPTAIPVEDRCPHCGGEPPEMDDHRDSCPTLGTCAQCHPSTPRPWHTEGEWWPDETKFSDALAAHMREAHVMTADRPVTKWERWREPRPDDGTHVIIPGRWVHNHIENGHVQGDRPKPVDASSKLQTESWADGEWRFTHGFLVGVTNTFREAQP